MVACFIEEYRDEIPQIGKVVEVHDSDSEVKIEWWIGTYTGTWRALTKKDGRKTVLWTESVPTASIISEVSFTKSSKLPKAIKEQLQKAY